MIVVASADEAQRLLEDLKGGANFAALAAEKSVDPTGRDGGYLGRLDPATLRPELRDALQGIGPGELTGVVRIPSGYAIVEVLPDTQGIEAPDPNPTRLVAATASGAVRDSLNVGGLSEADSMFLAFPKPAGWNQDLREMCRVRTESIPAILDRLEQNPDPVGAPGAGESQLEVLNGQYAWAQIHAYVGDLDKAIARWEVAKRIADESVAGAVAMMEETLGLAWLHKAEMDNGVYRAPGDFCLLPRINAPPYPDTTGAAKAVDYFLKALEREPDDPGLRWQLNLASMALGRYPDGVPPKYLIPPSAFASKDDIGRFLDVALQAGLKVFSMAGGAIVDRFESHDLLDVVTSSMDVCEPLHYFRNNGDGTFAEQTRQAGLADQLGGLNLVQADYNNDGCMDILVLRGGWEFPKRKSLLRNNCDGTFTDVTGESGLGQTVQPHADRGLGRHRQRRPARSVRRQRDRSERAVSPKGRRHVRGHREVRGRRPHRVHQGRGRGRLRQRRLPRLLRVRLRRRQPPVSQQPQPDVHRGRRPRRRAGAGRSFAAWFFDYDNDGWHDLFVTSYYLSIDEVARTYLGLPRNAETLKLYRNLGNGTFRNVTAEVGLDKVLMPMGANFGDVDNDGFLDIYLGMGSPSFASMSPHVLLRNQGGKAFVDVTASSGTGELHKGHGIAFADLDHDGDADIVAEVGGAAPADRTRCGCSRTPAIATTGSTCAWSASRATGPRSAPGSTSRWRVRRRRTAWAARLRHAPSIAPSAAAVRSGRTRWSSTSGWGRPPESGPWRSGGRPAIPGRPSPTSRRTSRLRSRSWRRNSPGSIGNRTAWAGRTGDNRLHAHEIRIVQQGKRQKAEGKSKVLLPFLLPSAFCLLPFAFCLLPFPFRRGSAHHDRCGAEGRSGGPIHGGLDRQGTGLHGRHGHAVFRSAGGDAERSQAGDDDRVHLCGRPGGRRTPRTFACAGSRAWNRSRSSSAV